MTTLHSPDAGPGDVQGVLQMCAGGLQVVGEQVGAAGMCEHDRQERVCPVWVRRLGPCQACEFTGEAGRRFPERHVTGTVVP
jgi:hypothetical protein